jgi:5'-3' exonuclease
VRGGGAPRLTEGGPDALGGINPGVLAAVVGRLATMEDAAMAHADESYYRRCEQAQRRARNGGADIEDYPLLNPMPRVVRPADVAGWRQRYYHYLFGDADAAREATRSYVAGLAWAMAYMEQRCLSPGWYYPHAYAPTALDLHRALLDPADVCAHTERAMAEAERAMAHAERAMAHAEHAQLQLLMVLPPASARTLIPELMPLMEDPALGCAHMFPSSFRVATYLRDKLWECTPLLPPWSWKEHSVACPTQ